jgi:MoaA/NifB/PqqE/SkfB family radical SAM enzyme
MPAVIPQISFAIHVTYTVPLACTHCCFSSSPKNRDRLHTDHIAETIRQLPSDMQLVSRVVN